MAKRTGFAGAAAAIPADLQQDLLKDIEFSRDEASLLGKGTFGAVYRGRLDGQEVAIKCIPFPPTATDWKYLQTETALLKSMRHNNLLRYYGLGLDMDRKEILVVTEYMGGGDLASLLFNSSTPVPWTLKLRVACDVLEGIVFLHSNDVVHRDIKPENVLVDDNWRCAVSDYGLARKVSHGEAMTCCGTYATMAPEVIWGEPYDQRADVFSYGMLLWEIIYRQHSSEEGFLARHPRTKFKLDLDALKEGAPPGTPESLVILATQCCCEEPDYRQSSAEALEWLMDLLREVEAAEGPAGERSAWPSAAVLKAEAAAKEASLKAAAAAAAAAADAAAAAAAASEEDADAGAADVSGVVESEQ